MLSIQKSFMLKIFVLDFENDMHVLNKFKNFNPVLYEHH